MASKLWVRIFYVASILTVILAAFARPALAVIIQGGIQLSRLAESPKTLEAAELVLFGIGFLALAFVVRRFQAPAQ